MRVGKAGKKEKKKKRKKKSGIGNHFARGLKAGGCGAVVGHSPRAGDRHGDSGRDQKLAAVVGRKGTGPGFVGQKSAGVISGGI